MKKKPFMKFTDESSVTFQSSISGAGEFGLSETTPKPNFEPPRKKQKYKLYQKTRSTHFNYQIETGHVQFCSYHIVMIMIHITWAFTIIIIICNHGMVYI